MLELLDIKPNPILLKPPRIFKILHTVKSLTEIIEKSNKRKLETFDFIC